MSEEMTEGIKVEEEKPTRTARFAQWLMDRDARRE